MSTYNIRLGSMLSFDEAQEKDIIKVIEYLNATHSTGKFMSNLIRVAFDNPEIIDMSRDSIEKGALLKQLESLGTSQNRANFFNQLDKEVKLMKQKVDKVYDMSMKTYMLAQMGKHLGLEAKSDNNLMAGFVLEKQLRELQDTLGTAVGINTFESSKLENAHKRAEDALEYMIEAYDDILSELKKQFEVQNISIPIQTVVNTEQIPTSIPVNNDNSIIDNKTVNNNVSVETDSDNVDDEIIDYGGDNFEVTDALADFFNS